MLLNSKWVTEEIKEEIKKKNLETNENENTMIPNLWDVVEAILMGKFKAIQPYLRKQQKSQIYNPTLLLKELEKEQRPN